ncbi:hypothetical protein ACYUOO_004776 [Klebsiella aerogenes]
MALTLTGATNRLPNRSPDKALCAAIREPSPVALTLTGATNRLPNRSPDKALCAAIRVFTPLIPAIFFFSVALYTAGGLPY